uniref:Uncharacterized protein n=1 Tax=Manihot esculenta TaxID=3983 RepID=A0A251JFD3_MANES
MIKTAQARYMDSIHTQASFTQFDRFLFFYPFGSLSNLWKRKRSFLFGLSIIRQPWPEIMQLIKKKEERL